MWMLFGPSAVICIVAGIGELGEGWGGAALSLVMFALAVLPVVVLYRVTRHYIRSRHEHKERAPEEE